ncbi:protein C9orf135-like isoform X2 [Gigantopelta aegis]|uniref:protein C9orf135-like isoform X2 n=1 Tax=Gigantopelta aegis TaxID=1735272 RepID=UPI001B889E6E|nr:protein C9orf135-like isoform X2 [Gigantopelta aegis]
MADNNVEHDALTHPGAPETKGSVYLRSDHMNYGRATLVTNWDQAREAEVKDYDFNKAEVRDFSRSTYKRLGNVTDGSFPLTTYQDHTEQLRLKRYYEEQDVRKPILDADTVKHAVIDRDIGTPKKGYGSILPHHHPDHNKMYLETTHRTDFKPPYPYTPKEDKPVELPDHTFANKKCNSQFTDTADWRRPGRNTWQDETGIYSNIHYKRQLYKPTYIVQRLE